ncbi:MAG: uroporphyrinogen-III C-methyltransferase [Burkholderiales bacterium]|nr:uroporphyrinogen-III C-methyltransferase [Burkholderiales bacterium]
MSETPSSAPGPAFGTPPGAQPAPPPAAPDPAAHAAAHAGSPAGPQAAAHAAAHPAAHAAAPAAAHPHPASPALHAASRPARAPSALLTIAAAALLAACAVSGWLAWQASQRVQALEQELVRRQQSSQDTSTEARMMAKQAQDLARETAARSALIEARVAEVAVQRGQLEELIQSLSRSRDENLVVDIDAALRVAQQQAALTASAEPLVAALRTADERIARVHQPRLDGVRRALARDLDRVRAVTLADAASLVIKLDEAMRLIDEVPLQGDRPAPAAAPARAAARPGAASAHAGSAAAQAAQAPVPASAPAAGTPWLQVALSAWDRAWDTIATETRNLVRVRRVEHPEALLLTPEQAYFLRENLKLRILNARMALLSRQYATAQADLRVVLDALPRHVDMRQRKAVVLRELVADVAARSVRAEVPRPDETLAALAAVAAGR